MLNIFPAILLPRSEMVMSCLSQVIHARRGRNTICLLGSTSLLRLGIHSIAGLQTTAPAFTTRMIWARHGQSRKNLNTPTAHLTRHCTESILLMTTRVVQSAAKDSLLQPRTAAEHGQRARVTPRRACTVFS